MDIHLVVDTCILGGNNLHRGQSAFVLLYRQAECGMFRRFLSGRIRMCLAFRLQTGYLVCR
jgi:hypothetical protein